MDGCCENAKKEKRFKDYILLKKGGDYVVITSAPTDAGSACHIPYTRTGNH